MDFDKASSYVIAGVVPSQETSVLPTRLARPPALPDDIVRNIRWNGLVGVSVGGLAALAAGRLLARGVDGMQTVEPLTFTLMVSVLVAAALFASSVPARRASRIDPVRALHRE